MDLESIILSEISQRRQIYDFTYMCNDKKLINKENRWRLVVAMGCGRGWVKGVKRYILSIIK